ncbi:hypothetical protein L596_027015 [Steinernema carpocapsae]|uniref:Exonuclease domain-containing protein n=1 Tax=Steinernema carpocapsae TaxID=34508 RepID=A0A4U5M321_STECR|nr:hypothetical protein L596_027015 [Steinernema carpocapsae]
MIEDPNEPLRCEGYQVPKHDFEFPREVSVSDEGESAEGTRGASAEHWPANARSPEAAPAEGSPPEIQRRVLPEQTSATLRFPRRHRLRVHLRGRSRLPSIIEFPAVFVDTHLKKIVSRFRTFVRPRVNPVLSAFCVELTGVNKAPRFSEAVRDEFSPGRESDEGQGRVSDQREARGGRVRGQIHRVCPRNFDHRHERRGAGSQMMWRLNLPYRIVNICKHRFMSEAYADCDLYDEDANFYEKAANRK